MSDRDYLRLKLDMQNDPRFKLIAIPDISQKIQDINLKFAQGIKENPSQPEAQPVKPKPRGRNPRPGVLARQNKAKKEREEAARTWWPAATRAITDQCRELSQKELLAFAIEAGAPDTLKVNQRIFIDFKNSLPDGCVKRCPNRGRPRA